MYVGQMVLYVTYPHRQIRPAVITCVAVDEGLESLSLIALPEDQQTRVSPFTAGRFDPDKAPGTWHYIPESEKSVRVDPFRKPKLGDWVVYVDNYGNSSDGRIESLEGETSIRKLELAGPIRAVYHVVYQKEGSVRSWHWPEDEDDESNGLWAEDVTIPPRPPQVDEQVVFVDRSGESHAAMVVQGRGDRRIDLRTGLSTRKRVRYSEKGRPNSWSYYPEQPVPKVPTVLTPRATPADVRAWAAGAEVAETSVLADGREYGPVTREPMPGDAIMFVDTNGRLRDANVIAVCEDGETLSLVIDGYDFRSMVPHDATQKRDRSWHWPSDEAAPSPPIAAPNVGIDSLGLNAALKPIVDPDGRALESTAAAAREWGLAKVAEIIGLTGLWKAKDVFERVKVLVDNERRLYAIVDEMPPE